MLHPALEEAAFGLSRRKIVSPGDKKTDLIPYCHFSILLSAACWFSTFLATFLGVGALVDVIGVIFWSIQVGEALFLGFGCKSQGNSIIWSFRKEMIRII